MRVTTTSDQPHVRSLETPYTALSIKASTGSRDADKQQELEFLALLVQALHPKIGLNRVNEALRDVLASEGRLDFQGAERK